MRHNLIRVVDPKGETYLQNEYGGPEAGWNFNRVVKQLYGDFLYQFKYERIQYVPAGEEFINYPALRVAFRYERRSLSRALSRRSPTG